MNQFKHVVCPGCTCLCDDLEVSFDRNRFEIKNACELGRRWFANPMTAFDNFVDGEPAEFTTAISAAALLLSQASAPLICGLDHLTTQAQQSAWRLADCLEATIDSTLTNAGRAGQFALQRSGCVTATLGEVANRSDLVLFWYCDPESSHPRHLARYSRPASGTGRTVVVIDDHLSATAEQADFFVELPRCSAANAVAVIRGLLRRIPMDKEDVLAATGSSIDQWRKLVEMLTEASYGALFYGPTTNDSAFDPVTDMLAVLIRELNDQTRFVSLAMRDDSNAQSAENVLTWSSGFPFAINLHQGLPRSSWLEYSAETVLSRGECDLVLLASTGSLAGSMKLLNSQAAEYLQRIPKIIISEVDSVGMDNTRVSLNVSRPGQNSSGDFCRQDDVALPLTNLFPEETGVTGTEVLEAIRAVVEQI